MEHFNLQGNAILSCLFGYVQHFSCLGALSNGFIYEMTLIKLLVWFVMKLKSV